ncbi:L-fucose/L-arabinose isomerase family protein [Tessaracoccus sp. OS52]|uniref:L-fucose/L-arabinose isomerase family protein n=1 Tax=Tessaracoccus sp. OS52 TaxID=2886691 RepID=UPI001D0F7F54|nr:L-fucose/L-arabinose isomerase family protein [Tessaracoccus sp. OS52]MCC2594370.1 L-fucose/L-arabinose isomerase family protein [Tessaracoccus sp. OS52]
MIERRKPLTARVGIVSVGHHVYWDQFAGLRDEMLAKTAVLASKVAGNGVEVVDFGLVDEARSAYAVLPRVRAADLDLLLVDMVTYATSSTFGVLIRALDVPVVMVALQPRRALDYANATTHMQLANDDFCSVPEFAAVAVRMGRPVPEVILGTLHDDPGADAELAQWCQIAKVYHSLRTARIGLMGHVLESMLDMHTDPTALTAAFGAHVVLCEPEDIQRHWADPDPGLVAAKKDQILGFFDTPEPVSDPITMKLTDADLETAARAAVALDGFIAEKDLDGLAYYYEGLPGSEMRTLMTNLIVGNSLLQAQGFPMCGEFDIKTCVAMMVMDRLEIGGSFAEFHPIDFERDAVLVGHDGPHHINIAEGKPAIRSLKKYHGKPGSGASVEFNIKEGPITMLGNTITADGKFKFVIAEGESLHLPVPPTGNTNTLGRFQPDVRTFLKRWIRQAPTHHYALGIGHHAQTITKVADTLGIESVIVAND